MKLSTFVLLQKILNQKKIRCYFKYEIVEHVSDLNLFISQTSKLLKKDGIMFIATINKTLKSYIFAIIGAEYILRWLPIGTHNWEKFVEPESLKKIAENNSLILKNLQV